SVVVTHDATMRLHPELFTSRDKRFYDPLYGWSSRASTLVITTTNAAKADIAREWNVESTKIRVTHLASAECFRPLNGVIDRTALRVQLTGSDTPYFLFVGKLSGRRNLPKLLEAFAIFRSTTSHPHKLVMVGPQYAITALEKMADELGVRAHLVTRTFVKDSELNDLYNCAEAFVMPSTYETVSFPIMEAQAAGTPVICIDTPGSREITGGEAVLIPRLHADDLVAAMTRIATDPALRARLAKRGLENAARFSWRRCAETTLQVCAEAARTTARAG
ncbi:MAG TPA: glycosyltransferase family 1 protein, partial [Gemmatimonadaceae bacterium]|nr:glycosyltransferase family 1 protein [Gemmatimonadaceae bacterium]